MSYKVKQFKRNQLPVNNYLKIIEEFSNENNYSRTGRETVITESLKVKDSSIKMPEGMKLEKGKNYYFTFKSNEFESYKVKLINTDTQASMTIKTIQSGYSRQEVIFCPNDNYNLIVFELIRNLTNANNLTRVGLRLDTLQSEIFKLYELTNILTTSTFSDVPYIKKFGLQGPPGLVFCMNGEEMRLGKSGIYEVEDINVNNLAFVLKNQSPIPFEDAVDFFILDYQY